MEIAMFAEGSKTTLEHPNEEIMKNYFRGAFLSVSTLSKDLQEYGAVELHILSDEFGYVRGDDKCSKYIEPNNRKREMKEATAQIQDSLFEAVRNVDVVIILFTASTFLDVVANEWNSLTEEAKPNTIWCIGVSRNSLDSVNLDSLSQKGCEIITYKRVGVARIGNETRQQLIDLVEELDSTQAP